MFFALCVLAALRLLLVHDIALPIVNSPHDGSLYVSRAYYLVTQHNFGPYDSRLFVKLPGISIIMAISRWLGFDYVTFLNLLHIGAATYVAIGLIRLGAGRLFAATVFAITLFAPLTVSSLWFNFDRENIDAILTLLFFSSLTFGLREWRAGRLSGFDVLVFALSGTGLIFLREEEILLFAVAPLLLLGEGLSLWNRRERFGLGALVDNRTVQSCAVWLMTAGFVYLVLMLFFFVRYNVLLINDFSGGTFPRFVAALRSVSTDDHGPHVSITREGLRRAGELFPEVRRLIVGIPALPPPDSDFARRFGITDEWTNSHMMFWVKDAAFGAGLTPTARAAQSFFRRAAIGIEEACAAGRVTCIKEPASVVPPVKAAWLPHIWPGLVQGLQDVLEIRGLTAMGETAPEVIGAEGAGWSEALRLGRLHQFTAKAPFDSLAQTAKLFPSQTQSSAAMLSVDYWCRYRDIAVHKDFGVFASVVPEFYGRFAKALGLSGSPADLASLSGPEATAKATAFLRAHQAQACWDITTEPLVDAALVFLKQGAADALLLPTTGAARHATEHGIREGRTWSNPVSFTNPAALAVANAVPAYAPSWPPRLRALIVRWLCGVDGYVLILGAAALLFGVKGVWQGNPLAEPLLIFILFVLLKVVALGYVSITMDLVDDRIYASANYCLLILGVAFIGFSPLGSWASERSGSTARSLTRASRR